LKLRNRRCIEGKSTNLFEDGFDIGVIANDDWIVDVVSGMEPG
jgi:hypothetical protein